MPVSPATVAQFAAKIKGMQTEALALKDETRREIFRVVESHRKEINDAIRRATAEGGKALPSQNLPRLSQTIAAEREAMNGEVIEILKQANTDAINTAVARAQAIADVAELEGAFFSVSPELAAIANSFSADLITTISPDLLPKVNSAIGRAAMGTISPYDAMKAVDEAMGIAGSGGVSYNAERIIRTEVGRVYNVTLDTQLQSLQTYMPKPDELEKTWVSGPYRPGRREEHQAMDGVTVPFNQPFVLPSGARLMFPQDPSGPADETINCGCTYKIEEKSVLRALGT